MQEIVSLVKYLSNTPFSQDQKSSPMDSQSEQTFRVSSHVLFFFTACPPRFVPENVIPLKCSHRSCLALPPKGLGVVLFADFQRRFEQTTLFLCFQASMGSREGKTSILAKVWGSKPSIYRMAYMNACMWPKHPSVLSLRSPNLRSRSFVGHLIQNFKSPTRWIR